MVMKKIVLGWIDYCMFSGLLGLSLLTGIYFGFFVKQKTTSQYLFGEKNMNYIAVATSILASFLSGITFLGIPTEAYLFGSQYFAIGISALLIALMSSYLIMPYFHELGVSSCLDYLELRFTKSVRLVAATSYMITLIVYMPLVIYVPSLAFAQLTGFSIYAIAPVFSLVCIAYTSMGGVKAVVWSDTIQFFFTLAGFIAVMIIGLISVGGFSEVWRINSEGHRLKFFNMDPSPFKRDTFWTITIGMTSGMFARFSFGQKFVQRILSIKKRSDIKKAVFLSAFSWGTIQCGCVFLGLLMYAKYYKCDPLKAKLIDRSDQTLPFYVMDIAGHIHGLPGLFLSGIVSSALSTMSATLNTLSATIYDTYIAQFIPEGPTKDCKATKILKIISVLAGFMTIGLIFLIERLGTIFEISLSLTSITEGAILGLFSVGMLFPCVGKTGAMTGSFVSILIMSWIIGGIQWQKFNHKIIHEPLPTSVEGCSFPINETFTYVTPSTIDQMSLNVEEEPMLVYRISVLYFTIMGSLITVIVALITSYLVRENDLSKVNPEHVLPFIRRFLPKEKYYTEIPVKEINMKNNFDDNNQELN